MSKIMVTDTYLSDIADAIRQKNGTSSTYTPGQMASGILALKTEPILQEKTVAENGTVTADEGYDGLSSVMVDVEPLLQEKTVNFNGTVTPDQDYYGLSSVVVQVAGGSTASLQSKYIDQNGIYEPDVGYDGFSSVTVNVPSGGSYDKLMTKGQVSTTGNYATAQFESGVDLSRYDVLKVDLTRTDTPDGSTTLIRPESYPSTFYIQGASYRYTILLSANAIQCAYYSGNYVNLYVDVYGYTLPTRED